MLYSKAMTVSHGRYTGRLILRKAPVIRSAKYNRQAKEDSVWRAHSSLLKFLLVSLVGAGVSAF